MIRVFVGTRHLDAIHGRRFSNELSACSLRRRVFLTQR